jgi:hypothetical protein
VPLAGLCSVQGTQVRAGFELWACAVCLIAERASSYPDWPLAAAHGLRTTTFFGGFELGVDGRQTGHRLSVVQWRGGRRQLVVPDVA